MSNELDSNMANIAFLMCFGSFIQNEENQLTIKSKQTVDALKFMASIYKTGETDEIFGWNPASNNNFLYSGKGSMILNAISATRTPEDQHLPFVDDLWIWPIPAGPHGRLGLEHVMGCYVDLEVREEQAGRGEVPRRPDASTTSRRRWRASSTTSRASRERFRSSDQDRREG